MCRSTNCRPSRLPGLSRGLVGGRAWQREPRISVSRSVLPIVSDIDRMYFLPGARSAKDGVWTRSGLPVEGTLARFWQELIFGRARRHRGRAGVATPPSGRRTRCYSPCPTNSAWSTTLTSSRTSSSTSPRRWAGVKPTAFQRSDRFTRQAPDGWPRPSRPAPRLVGQLAVVGQHLGRVDLGSWRRSASTYA